ncbi:MAG TPA: class I SAM-dependent methyltransferase [Candidatus Baltobacteraceae bacterium]|jgi:predicted O-methyltransferase YrrM|nr:class I SAM-dependent methyltransferase [Candidatus Baltobacteraceae bacterium]
MSSRSAFIPQEIQQYIDATTLRDLPVLRDLREETAKHPRAGMQTGADQVQFLQLLVRLVGARRCIEVGVFTGYSSLGVALALPDDGKIIACDVSEEYTAIARRYWERAGVAGKIDLYLAPATQTLDELIAAGEEGRFDFAYIDADKTGYDAYYERCLKLLRPNGLVTIDNVLWSGDVVDENTTDEDTLALRTLNEKIGRDQRVDASLLPIGDGLMVVRKK